MPEDSGAGGPEHAADPGLLGRRLRDEGGRAAGRDALRQLGPHALGGPGQRLLLGPDARLRGLPDARLRHVRHAPPRPVLALLQLCPPPFHGLLQLFLVSPLSLFSFIPAVSSALLLGPDAEDAPIVELWPVALCTAVYGLVGMATYFTRRLPSGLHRVYVITNCSLVSLYYLRCLPGNTAWVVLVAVACWDMFAVLSPYGPLNIVQAKAKDYSADVCLLSFSFKNCLGPPFPDVQRERRPRHRSGHHHPARLLVLLLVVFFR